MSCVESGELGRNESKAVALDESIKLGRRSFARNNGSVVSVSGPLDIDEKLLIDPKLLFVGSKIGEGAHGKVYQGKYRDQIVAIKVVNGGCTTDEKEVFEERFIREVNMMSKVKHENLVKFIGACKHPIMVIATELLPGMSLKKYLSSIKPQQLDIGTAVSYALDIARAMDCLHANGIIHRDLKPDNLLLTANKKQVKLIDFGLAREETVNEMMTAETGTYRWMAPEQMDATFIYQPTYAVTDMTAEITKMLFISALYSTVTLRRGEKKHYTNKVDVYSFGIVLWELLTNKMPFEGMSNLQAAYAAAFKQMRPPLPNDTPPELVFIVQSCWVEDPNTRPCFNQIVRMLDSFLCTLPPPPKCTDTEAIDLASRSTSAVISATSARAGGRKLSFIRQLFAAKKAANV